MKSRILLSALVAMTFAATPVLAAPATADEEAIYARAAYQINLLVAGPSSPLDSVQDIRTATPHIAAVAQISASNEDKRASILIGASDSMLHGEYLTATSWSFAISSALGDSGATTILSSNGLSSDFLAKFGFSWFSGTLHENFRTELDAFRPAMEAYQHCAASIPQLPDGKLNVGLLVATCGDVADGPGLVKRYGTKVDLKAFDNAVAVDNAIFLGFDASVGYKKFKFFDAMSAASNNSTGTPWSAEAFGAWSPGTTGLLLKTGFAYQRSYAEGTKGTLCPLPSPAPLVLTCVTGAIGAPTLKEELLATFEVKRELPLPNQLADLGLAKIGIDAKFSYDTKSNVYNFDLPLSFVADKDGKLIGGVELGWSSDSHAVVAGLFVSSAFSLGVGD